MATFTRPTASSALTTHVGLRNATNFTKEYVQDVKIVNLWSPLHGLQNATGPANLISVGTGGIALAEISTSEISAFKFDSDTDSVSVLWIPPHDMDPNEDVDFRCLWSNSEAAGTGSNLWVVTYKIIIFGGTTATAAATTVLDTPVVNQVDLAAHVAQWSSWGTCAAGKLTTVCPGTDGIVVKIACDISTCADASLYLAQARYRARYL